MTRMTKAQLVDENICLRAQCDALEREYYNLNTGYTALADRYNALSTSYSALIEKSDHQVPGDSNARATPSAGIGAPERINEDEAFNRGNHATHVIKTSGPRAHATYAEYCMASRKAQRARGLRVITLQSREQWEARAPMEQAS